MVKKQNKEIKDEETEVIEEDTAEPRVYELGFHIDPELPQEEVKSLYQAIKDAIAAIGTVIAVGEPEKMQLAYTISRMEHEGRHDFKSSFFTWIAYETNNTGHTTVLETLREETRIFRFIDILTEKEVVEHAAEQRDLRKHTQEKTEETKEVSEEELDNALEEASI